MHVRQPSAYLDDGKPVAGNGLNKGDDAGNEEDGSNDCMAHTQSASKQIATGLGDTCARLFSSR